MIDCQMKTAHLATLGAREIPRAEFVQGLSQLIELPHQPGRWQFDHDLIRRDFPPRRLQFYLTAPYQCSYLPEQSARSQVVTPNELVDDAAYSQLIRAGFRRSGLYTYRPQCDQCRACVPVRLMVEEFKPNRSQRRTWKRNQQLEATLRELVFDVRHYALYRRYQASRHAGGGMDQDSEDQYRQFLLQSGVSTMLLEFRDASG